MLDVEGPPTQRSVLDALEARYPMLRGTIRDHSTHQRRPFVRFFACEEDLSHDPPDTPLPEAVASGDGTLHGRGGDGGGLTTPESPWGPPEHPSRGGDQRGVVRRDLSIG